MKFYPRLPPLDLNLSLHLVSTILSPSWFELVLKDVPPFTIFSRQQLLARTSQKCLHLHMSSIGDRICRHLQICANHFVCCLPSGCTMLFRIHLSDLSLSCRFFHLDFRVVISAINLFKNCFCCF